MKLTSTLFVSLTLWSGSAILLAEPVLAQRPGGSRPEGTEAQRGPVDVHVAPTEPGIAWFGTWDAALAEAKRTGRPMLFLSAAPHCSGVPGVW